VLLTGVFAAASIGGLFRSSGRKSASGLTQLYGVAVTLGWTVVVT
jgi:hypothetical protein